MFALLRKVVPAVALVSVLASVSTAGAATAPTPQPIPIDQTIIVLYLRIYTTVIGLL